MTTPTKAAELADTRASKLEALVHQAKAAKKLSERLASTPAPTVHNAAKSSEKQLSDKVQLDRHMHEIHCLTVELGLADAQPHRYGEKKIAIGFGREILDPRRAPATLQESLIVETRTYLDGTIATGVAPLPDESPASGANASVRALAIQAGFHEAWVDAGENQPDHPAPITLLMQSASLLRASEGRVPEGWRMVPIVATQAMCETAHYGPQCAEDHMTDKDLEWLREMWSAMLTAAPHPPAQQAGPDGTEGWEGLAWELCADEHGEESCGELIWEGGPIPEPWGERWLKYEDEAKRLIALVHKHTSPPPHKAEGAEPPTAKGVRFYREADDAPKCRDCADFGPICPNSGQPCGAPSTTQEPSA